MKKTVLLFALMGICWISACQQEELDDIPLVGGGCGSEGARMDATVDGSDWCANTSLIAVAGEGSASITGVALNGNTLIIQIDSLALGAQPIDEMQNGVLWMELGTPFTSTNDDPGTLTILQLDENDQRMGGTVDAVLHDAENPAVREVHASFDVHYTLE